MNPLTLHTIACCGCIFAGLLHLLGDGVLWIGVMCVGLGLWMLEGR
jgi:hypothetical protein